MHEQGITRDRLESRIKTQQQRLLPYFLWLMSLIVCFCLESLLMLITLSSVWEKIRVKNIFQHKHKHFDRMQTWEAPPTTTNPHLSAPPLAHWRKLNICLFSPSLLQNLASLSNFSFFFSFFFLVRSGIPSPQANSIYSTFFFFFLREPSSSQPSCTWNLGDGSTGTENPVQSATGQASIVFRPR